MLAFGVFWVPLAFAIAGIGTLAGVGSVLTQYGLRGTVLDLVFDTVGGIVVAVWGTVSLTDVSGALARHPGIATAGSGGREED